METKKQLEDLIEACERTLEVLKFGVASELTIRLLSEAIEKARNEQVNC